MFSKDRFIDDCKAAVGGGQKAIRELVLEAVADPAGIVAELGEPNAAGVYPCCEERVGQFTEFELDEITRFAFESNPF